MNELKTFVILGESSEPIAVINASTPQELSEKASISLTEQYDGGRPEYSHLFDFNTAFNSWDCVDLVVHVHDTDELPEESSFYVETLTIQRCISF